MNKLCAKTSRGPESQSPPVPAVADKPQQPGYPSVYQPVYQDEVITLERERTKPLYLLQLNGLLRSGLWTMPTTNYSYISVIFIECVVTL